MVVIIAEEIESVRKDSAVRQIQQKQINDFSGKRFILPRVTALPTVGLPSEVVVLIVAGSSDKLYIWDDGASAWIEK